MRPFLAEVGVSESSLGYSEIVTVLDAMREGLQVIGRDWRYLYLNQAAADHGRRPREELLGRTMSECYPGVEQSEMFGLLRRCMDGEGHQRMLNQFIYPDGRSAWFELRFEPVPLGVAVLSVDVTEQRLLEHRLQQTTRIESLGRLAGGVAHDFNNLLTIISGYATFAAEAVPEGSRAAADLKQIEAAAERAGVLTGQLLAFSRVKPTTPAPLDVDEVIGSVLEMMARLLGDGVEVVRACDGGLPVTLMDRGALDQVIMNLVLNAREAMDGQGVLTVETRFVTLDEAHVATRGRAVPPGSYVVVAISDTGRGMTADVLEQIFEPFFTTRSGRGGTGLGLATCHGLVHQAGGYIWAYSEPDLGTTFRVYLPVSVDAADPFDAAHPSDALAGDERILVVDDDLAILDIAVRSLRRHGYDVRVARTVEEALEALGRDPAPALLITDLSLPGMSGAELATTAVARHAQVRTLFMSGYTELALQARSQRCELIEKPFRPEQFARRVREVLDRQAERLG